MSARTPAIWGTVLIVATLLLGLFVNRGTPGFDIWLSLALSPLRQAGGADFWLFVTSLGDAEVRVVVGLAVAGWLAFTSRWRWALLLLSVAGIETLTNSGLKLLFARARPDLLPQLDIVSSLAFPSGHAAHSAALYLMIGLIAATMLSRRSAKIAAIGAALALVALIGVSRVVLGVHWPTDVAGGWAFGAGCALLGWGVGSRRLASPRDRRIVRP